MNNVILPLKGTLLTTLIVLSFGGKILTPTIIPVDQQSANSGQISHENEPSCSDSDGDGECDSHSDLD